MPLVSVRCADIKMASKFPTGVIGKGDGAQPTRAFVQVGTDENEGPKLLRLQEIGHAAPGRNEDQREADIETAEAKIQELEAADQLTDEDRRLTAQCRELIDKSREYLKMAENADKQLRSQGCSARGRRG